ncbi:hypothetical protein ACIQOW_05360 [Kitasatospora sp. NPDC091335]|uniref:hypothetical protein n=1 Tax=Kitasatospora sp. NPDC091335 TaxID=3364085 RepID=UPI0037F62A46
MTVPPPPTQPPTVGMPDAEPEPVVEWWRRSGPWSQRTAPEPEAEPVDLRKTAPDDAGEDQADEDQGDEAGPADPQQPVPPPAPSYDMDSLVNRLGLLISETPEERAERIRNEREDWYRRQGETPDQRKARHRSERLAQRHKASVLWRQPQSERARRFRRWCILTTASAVVGFNVGAVQLAAHLPLTVAAFAAAGAWVLDLRMRRWGHVRVSEVRGPGALTVLVLVRVPLASALVGALGLAPLITLLSSSHH